MPLPLAVFHNPFLSLSPPARAKKLFPIYLNPILLPLHKLRQLCPPLNNCRAPNTTHLLSNIFLVTFSHKVAPNKSSCCLLPRPPSKFDRIKRLNVMTPSSHCYLRICVTGLKKQLDSTLLNTTEVYGGPSK